MRKTTAWVTAINAVVLGVLLAASLPARADDRPLGDDQCSAQCDEESDKCNVTAGKDKDKRASCDRDYETCLQKCKG